MLQRFTTNITKKGLFSNEDKLLVAVSGGLDSMVLCDLLLKTGYTYSVAHCNFGLRGEEADGDEKAVEAFCKNNNLSYHLEKFNTAGYAKEKKLSIQMAARELRYNWFRELLQENSFDFLLTAHHLNDNIETFFINLLRGSGINGLKGIEEKKGPVVRPLLDFTKKELVSYAEQFAIAYREDKSNAEDKYLRNYLRLHVMPKLKEASPSFEQTFRTELKSLRDTYRIVKDHVEACRKNSCDFSGGVMRINIAAVKEQASVSLMLFELLKPYGFNSSTAKDIEECFDAEPGKLFYSGTHELLKDREHLVIREKRKTNEAGVFYIEKNSTLITTPVGLSLSAFRAGEKHFPGFVSPAEVILDADKLTFPLRIEKWTQGDKFKPLGMSGYKKLSDFFTAEKMSVFEKQEQWLLKSGEDIVWVIGRRMDERYKITEETRNCLTISLRQP